MKVRLATRSEQQVWVVHAPKFSIYVLIFTEIYSLYGIMFVSKYLFSDCFCTDSVGPIHPEEGSIRRTLSLRLPLQSNPRVKKTIYNLPSNATIIRWHSITITHIPEHICYETFTIFPATWGTSTFSMQVSSATLGSTSHWFTHRFHTFSSSPVQVMPQLNANLTKPVSGQVVIIWINVSQVVTIAVYAYFLITLFGRQVLSSACKLAFKYLQ